MVRRRSYVLYILLLIFWFLLTNNFDLTNILIGVTISLMVGFISQASWYSNGIFRYERVRFYQLFLFFCVLILEIYKSSFTYIVHLFKQDWEPIILECQLSITDPLHISIIANAITLTPGTVTIKTDGNKLTLLSLSKRSQIPLIEQNIKNKFERFFIKKG
jgi:multisubunit Na+/H+ antiporter MnhE subunit